MNPTEKKACRFSVAIAAQLLLALGWAPHAMAEDAPEAAAVARGATVWADNCGRCHNIRSPSEFRDDQWRVIVAHMRIRAGFTGQQSRDVLAFLQASNGRPDGQQPASAEISGGVNAGQSELTGQEIYMQTCVACHGTDGRGAIPGVPDFTASDGSLSKNDAQLFQSVMYGVQLPGSQMAMPPKGGNPILSDSDIRAVIQYLQTAFGH